MPNTCGNIATCAPVGPTPDNAKTINITQKTGGILHELEVAHIYIEQLNDSIKNKDAAIFDLTERLERVEALLRGQTD